MTTRELQDRLHFLMAQQNRPGISEDEVESFETEIWDIRYELDDRAYCAEHFTDPADVQRAVLRSAVVRIAREQDARAASEDRIAQHFNER